MKRNQRKSRRCFKGKDHKMMQLLEKDWTSYRSGLHCHSLPFRRLLSLRVESTYYSYITWLLLNQHKIIIK
jgi:hypothetical protein